MESITSELIANPIPAVPAQNSQPLPHAGRKSKRGNDLDVVNSRIIEADQFGEDAETALEHSQSNDQTVALEGLA